MAKSGKKHPLRKLTFIAVIAGVVIAIKNSIADKGGSYPPPVTPDRVPAEPAAEAAPVEEASPRTGDVPYAKDFVDSDSDDETAIATDPDEEDDRAPSRGRRKGPALARDEEIAEKKIDPFGFR